MSPAGGAEELLLASANDKFPLDWSPDGRLLLFAEQQAGGANRLFLLDLATRKTSPLAAGRGHESDGRFSRDGHWVAYVSEESGRPEVYLQAVAGPTRLPVSTGGGTSPRWSADGREIFYLSPDSRLMAVAVAPGLSPRLGEPHALFTLPPGSSEYQVARDGRFLLRIPEASPGQNSIHVVANWMAELKK